MAENPEALPGAGRAGAGHVARLGEEGQLTCMFALDAWGKGGRPRQGAADEGYTTRPGARGGGGRGRYPGDMRAARLRPCCGCG